MDAMASWAETQMKSAAGIVATLVLVNVSMAVGFGRPLARSSATALGQPGRHLRVDAALWVVYLLECIAFSASMATNVLGVCLAAMWGVFLGRLLRGQPAGKVAAMAVRASLYTCLPALSFVSLLPLLKLAGWPILSAEAGHRFGIPGFVPWPASTLLGFFLAVSVTAVVFKTATTTLVALWLSRRSGSPIPADGDGNRAIAAGDRPRHLDREVVVLVEVARHP